ncbi:hypothetical protein [Bradyrhizobium sp.]|uniref:hypothetical protein n=1 Tax=Bradyrhizobium sp. TaxID=376 RepID=UPI0025BF9843|nr:hypothetical protein [Bradyrhizobium sp.]
MADRTFLNLWSYPNLFIDRKQGGKGDGKELCDLLVMCGDDIIIFSDKSIEWPGGSDFETIWSRWYRRAVEKSVAQIAGAERWLAQFPDRIFLDPACTRKLPFALPPIDRRRVHGVIVALGAREACAAQYPGSTGSFLVTPDLKGPQHLDPASPSFLPFGIGDVRPEGSFIHVFDDRALDLVMSELDTLIDFTEYLTRRERIIRSGHLLPVTGEEELLGYYMTLERPDETHDFVKPDGGEWQEGERLLIPEGTFAGLANHRSYKAKKQADEISYVWDRLIEQFSNNILAGTSVHVFGEDLDAAVAEQALRTLALEPRVQRRLLGEGLIYAMRKAEELATDRFVRVALPGPHSADRSVGYVYLILAYPKIKLAGGYDQYRKVRTNMLHAYCLFTLSENRQLTRIAGMGFGASPKVTGRQGGSEDMLALEVHEWTPELEAQVKELREKFDVMDPNRVVKSTMSTDEYPAPSPLPPKRKKKTLTEAEVAEQKASKSLRKQDRVWREKQKRTPQ